MYTWDVIVVGGGSAGLSAALTLSRARRSTLVVDIGQPRNAIATHSHGVLGFDGAAPATMLERGREEIARFGGEIRTDEVVSAVATNGEFALGTAGGLELRSRQLIVASGVVDVLPPIPGLAELWGSKVVICPYCDGWEVRDRRIGILGTGPKSIFQANLLRQWSMTVILFTNDSVVPSDNDLTEFRARGIDVVDGAVLNIARRGDGVAVTTSAGTIECHVLFTAPRAIAGDRILRELGAQTAQTSAGSFVSVDARGATTVEGLWAAGNVVNPSLKVATAAGNGMDTGTHVNEALVRADTLAALRQEA